MSEPGLRPASHDEGDAIPVTFERRGPLALLTLNRPSKANALNQAIVTALLAGLDAAEADPFARAVVIRGAGKNFCAGADLKAMLEGGSDCIRSLMEILREFLIRLEQSRLAVVAAVQGAARAGGLELVLACDAVVASKSASFGDAHVANGLLPAGGATARLPRTVGWQRAKWLILSSSVISADTALEWGLITAACPDDELDDNAARIALELSRSSAETFSRAKKLIARRSDLPLEVALEAEIATLLEHAKSTAFTEGVSSFLRRDPKPKPVPPGISSASQST